MSCILKYRFVNDELCLEMNKEFMKRIELLKTIFKKIYNSDDIDCEKIAILNYDYLKSKFGVDDDFIKWWKNIVTHEYYIIINKLKGDLLPGFWLENCRIRSEYGLYQDSFWDNFLLFTKVCKHCLLGCHHINCGIPYNSCSCHHHCENYEHYVHMLSMMHEMQKKYEKIIQDLKGEPAPINWGMGI